METKRNPFRVFLGRSEMKRLLVRCMRSWDDNVKMSPKEFEWKVVD